MDLLGKVESDIRHNGSNLREVRIRFKNSATNYGNWDSIPIPSIILWNQRHLFHSASLMRSLGFYSLILSTSYSAIYALLHVSAIPVTDNFLRCVFTIPFRHPRPDHMQRKSSG